MTNASVLPVPVSAQATTSRPSRASGTTAVCTCRVSCVAHVDAAGHQPRIEAQRGERTRRDLVGQHPRDTGGDVGGGRGDWRRDAGGRRVAARGGAGWCAMVRKKREGNGAG